MIEPSYRDISIVKQCQLLDLPRSSYYDVAPSVQESAENLALMRLIDEE